MLDPDKIWPLLQRLNDSPEVKSQMIIQIAHLITLPLLFQIEAICLSLGARPPNAKPCTKNGDKFALMTSFGLENVDPMS